ncbi:MerR family transcriptional regulator [Salmonirosea aquatica]|uniref:MerR family transcriptional regulator n=1 Tax=Salmonirosea aquatica TaxID=2654236 RepID=A0A7C9BLG4_9BACT|nr:MerR family transcriptional regulator [Cytophagaceae bacterium SJW1-29]
MKSFSVKKVSKISGVSVRTLHHYDSIGLLKPSHRTEAGYRYYDEARLLRLQQILFYRELGFSLRQVREILDDPGFSLIWALENHRSALENRQKRIASLLVTIDRTIQNLKKGEIMTNPEQLYEGLPKEVGITYRQEAIDEYGQDAVDQSERALMKMTKEDLEKLKKEQGQIASELFTMQNENPESDAVQRVIARHYANIRMFWGTSNLPDKQAEAYAGLGELYVNDERFTLVNGVPQPGYALFMQKAMRHFANTQLKKASM